MNRHRKHMEMETIFRSLTVKFMKFYLDMDIKSVMLKKPHVFT